MSGLVDYTPNLNMAATTSMYFMIVSPWHDAKS